MSDVKIELAVRCYNMNVPNLESAIHAFFSKVNVAFEVYDSNGEKHYPRAPLSDRKNERSFVMKYDAKEFKQYPEIMNKEQIFISALLA